MSEDELIAALLQESIEWEYNTNAPENWRGYQGFFTSIEQIELFAQVLSKARASLQKLKG